MTQTKALNQSAATTGKLGGDSINECVYFSFWSHRPRQGIWTLVFGAYLEFGAWKLMLRSYQLLKVILDRSGVSVRKTRNLNELQAAAAAAALHDRS